MMLKYQLYVHVRVRMESLYISVHSTYYVRTYASTLRQADRQRENDILFHGLARETTELQFLPLVGCALSGWLRLTYATS